VLAPARHLTVVVLAASALALGACGGDDESAKQRIQSGTASELIKQLDSISDRFEAGGGACGDLPENYDAVDRALAEMPDNDLRTALEDSFARLRELTERDCEEPETETTTTPTETIEIPTTPVETIPTTPTETTPVPTTPEEGEGGGNGDEGNQGGGNGGEGNQGGADAPGNGLGE
jgi:hypothetical protein